MKANGRKFTYAGLSYMYTFFMFLNYGISVHANLHVYMQPLKCGNSDIFACRIENRAWVTSWIAEV